MPNQHRRGGRPWRRLRAFVLTRDHHRCQLAYPDRCTTRATQVDHVLRVVDRPDLELDPTNLRAVCIPCHQHRTATDAPPPDPPPSRAW